MEEVIEFFLFSEWNMLLLLWMSFTCLSGRECDLESFPCSKYRRNFFLVFASRLQSSRRIEREILVLLSISSRVFLLIHA